jgi:hypothetical protein
MAIKTTAAKRRPRDSQAQTAAATAAGVSQIH